MVWRSAILLLLCLAYPAMSSPPFPVDPSELSGVVVVAKPPPKQDLPPHPGPGPRSPDEVRGVVTWWSVQLKVKTCKTLKRDTATGGWREVKPAHKPGELVWVELVEPPALEVGDTLDVRTRELSRSADLLVHVTKRKR
jgi:hypothetical protein